jgi:enoyl-CoA hydratase/carnithine racemase
MHKSGATAEHRDRKASGHELEIAEGQLSSTAEMDLKVTRYRVDADGVAIVWFHRPGRGNSWTNRMHAEYRHLMAMLDDNPAVRVIVVTGTGRQFCVGADAKALEKYAEDSDRDYTASVDPSQMAQPGIGVNAAFETDIAWHWGMRVPVIAAINGACAGIAAAIATFADLRYMAEGAKWTTSTPRLGLPAEYGLPWVLPRIVGISNAAELVFTGRIVLAEELDRMGYLNGCYTQDGFLERVIETARMIATQVSPASATVAKRQLYRDIMRHDVRASIEEAKDMIQVMMDQPDYKEGVAALTEKRRPLFAAPTIEQRTRLSE